MLTLTSLLHSSKALRLFMALACCLCCITKTSAQPVGLPWQVDPACQSIITNGIAAVTCGTSVQVPPLEQFTFGMMNVTGAMPAAGRVDVSNQVEVYHHPSWRIDSIGNVFGITMDGCGNTYVTASSNYSSYFFLVESVIRYGDIGGGAESLEAAGTVYKIDGLTGQASVFSVLPQQAFAFENITCEGITTVPRNTGPGLGNIVFSHFTRQFYVTNFEDGRIYRLDEDGAILDSYDPLVYDTGTPGPPATLNDLAYGVDISQDGTQLFFGTSGAAQALFGPLPKIFSIPLNADGSFVGTVNNTTMPVGASWNNYVGTETQHFESPGTTGFTDVISISDIEFTPSGNLLVGGRMGCSSSIHTSYNHGGACWLVSPVGGVYSNLVGTIFTGYPSSLGGSSEAYGGVSVYNTTSGPDQFMISSADILDEPGPHGICMVEEGVFGATTMPASPAGAVSYGLVNNGSDPKGVGGDVKVFVQCSCVVTCQTEITASASDTVVCSGTAVNLSFSASGGNAVLTTTWTDADGNTITPDNLNLTNTDCAPVAFTYFVTAICQEDPTIVLTDSITITVFATDISSFVDTVQGACVVEVNIDPACADYLTLVGDLPTINPGDSGTVVVNVVSNDALQCANEPYTFNYNCPPCFISNLTAVAQECQDTTFLVEINLDVTDGSESFNVTDQNGILLGTFAYADLPVLVGPLYGDSITVYTLTVADAQNPVCTNTVDVGPKDCLPKCGFFEMPNAFSPNGDGINDTYYPVSLWEFQVLDFKIYNRWGELVHDSVERWDGKYKGKHHGSDVFVYIITVDTFCGVKKEHGDVTLLR